MSIAVKRVAYEDYHGFEKELLLCLGEGGYYINHVCGVKDTQTLISNIKDKEVAKKEFLELLWDLA